MKMILLLKNTWVSLKNTWLSRDIQKTTDNFSVLVQVLDGIAYTFGIFLTPLMLHYG